jgi:hypothetical protein
MNWRVWISVVALALGSSIWAEVPASMAVQAIFQDSSGRVLNGSHVIKVGIYDGNTLKWQETFPKIFSKGVFSEIIGIQNPITSETINLTTAQLGFVIDDGPVQFVRVTAVPYALHARFAKTAENIPAATATFLGGIKVGRGLEMDSNGVLSVPSWNYSSGVSINGTVRATSFVGDGSRLTNLNIARELGTVAVINGGTGLTGAPSDGQFLMGSGGGYVKTVLTQGAGMMITTGSESISIAHADTSTLNSFTLDGSVLTGLTVDRHGHLTGYKMTNFKDGISINGTMNANAFYANEAWINGTVTANRFVGDGSRLTGIPRYTTGPGLILINGSTLTVRDAIVTSNYNYGVSINSVVRALLFEGDGSRLTGIPRYTTGPGLNLNGSLLSLGWNVVTSNYNGTVWINGPVKATSFEGDGSRLTNLNTQGSAPITVTTTSYQMDDNTRFLIVNNLAGTTTILLPNPKLNIGRVIKIKTIQAQSVISMTPTVVPLNSENPGTAILSGVAGKWAELVSDGTNWVIMSGN